MAFTEAQVKSPEAKLNATHVRTRQVQDTTLTYVEGWHVIAEANRIFGYDGWDRRTVSTQCVWSGQLRLHHAAAYIARVRILVRAGDITITREGCGSGEAKALNETNDIEALFALWERNVETVRAINRHANRSGPGSGIAHILEAQLKGRAALAKQGNEPASEEETASSHNGAGTKVDKSLLAIPEVKHIRSKEHLRYVAGQPCVVCGELGRSRATTARVVSFLDNHTSRLKV